MIYVKSALVGLLAIVVGSIILPILAIIGIVLSGALHSGPEGASIGWDPISLVKQSPLVLVFIVVCFAAGFFWEFRRLMR